MAKWMGQFLGSVSLLAAACTGTISPSQDRPVSGPAQPTSEPAQVDGERFFRGQSLYDQNCAPCHGVFEESSKRGRPPESIEVAFQTIGMMQAFAPRVSEPDRADIAYALEHSEYDVPCPPLQARFPAIPAPREELATELATALELPRDAVDAALAGYRLGYDSSTTFDNRASATLIESDTTETLLEGMTSVARAWFSANPARESCADSVCAETAFREVASRWGRGVDANLSSAVDTYARATSAGLDPSDGLEMGLVRLLMSPTVVFRHLDPESASAQQRLVAAFASRSPTAPETSMDADALVDSLLRKHGGEVLSRRFALRWLGIHQMIDGLRQGDTTLLPVDIALLEDMAEQARLGFVGFVEDDRPISDLLVARNSHLNSRVAEHYGIGGVNGDAFQSVDLGGTRGGGLLSLGGVHLASAGSDETSPVVRGKWILENLLCLPLPPPPEIEDLIEEAAAGEPMTPREASASRRADQRCEGCHAVLDELGFGLERFGPWGAEREHYDTGDPVETHGQLPGGRQFDDHRGLAEQLSGSLAFRLCATRQLATYLMGRDLSAAEQCHVRRLAADATPETTAHEWIRAIAQSAPFQRTGAEVENDQ